MHIQKKSAEEIAAEIVVEAHRFEDPKIIIANIAKKIKYYRIECPECLEQARLLGMSGSREVSLLARIQDLERSLSEKDRMIRDLQIRDTRKTSVDERHNPPDEYKSIPRSKT